MIAAAANPMVFNPIVFSLALFGALERAAAFDKHVPFYKRIQKHSKPYDPHKSAQKEIRDLTARKAPGCEIADAVKRLATTPVIIRACHGGQLSGGALSPARKRQLERNARSIRLHTQASRNPAPSGAL